MSTKQSQLYMYFQNKAHHYQNIQLAKSKVVDKLDNSMNQTIDYISRQKYNRDLPVNKRYDIEVENEHMSLRLASIEITSRKEVDVKGNYSRYNSFERKFRLKNRFHDEEERQREMKNEKIREKIKNMKPQIGSHRFWESSYQNNTKLTKNSKSSKGNLMLDKKSFLAEAYLDFIHQVQHHESDKNLNELNSSRSSKGQSNLIAIDQQKLFALPNLTVRKTQKLKSSQVSVTNEEASSVKKEQQK